MTISKTKLLDWVRQQQGVCPKAMVSRWQMLVEAIEEGEFDE